MKASLPHRIDLGQLYRTEVLPRLSVTAVYGERSWRRAGAWLTSPCDIHDGKDYNFHVHPELLSWRCWSVCQESGDPIRYVERKYGLDFMDAVRWLADRVNVTLTDRLSGPFRRDRLLASVPVPFVRPVRVVEPPQRPPENELSALMGACRPVATALLSQAEPDRAASEFLRGRGWGESELDAIVSADLVRLTPLPNEYEWPKWWPQSWTNTWRLVAPAYESDGRRASLHARAVRPGAEPKTRWPWSCGSAGLFMACPLGTAVLRGETPKVDGVLLVEGLTGLVGTFLAVRAARVKAAILAFTSGGPPALANVAWPVDIEAWVATDMDDAGDRYAKQVNAALAPRGVRVCRVDPSLGGGLKT